MPQVHLTGAGTPYIREPGVSVLSVPSLLPWGMEEFLNGFDPELEFDDYLRDDWGDDDHDADLLAKIAGQLCYMSFSPARTRNAEAGKYLDNIKEQRHGSVLEHANITLLIWGSSRGDTHEIVRHRTGMAYSQVSQRYVDGKTLRFVERLEFQGDPTLHAMFERRIDMLAAEYELSAKELRRTMDLEGLSKRDARKAVNQAARACLPNETEAPIIVTGNTRAWRHFIEMRASVHADLSIRRIAFRVAGVLREWFPATFSDYTLEPETFSVSTPWRKV